MEIPKKTSNDLDVACFNAFNTSLSKEQMNEKTQELFYLYA